LKLYLPSAGAALALALPGAPLHADEPLYVKNLSPVTGLLGLPSQRDADTQSRGTLAAALHTSIASHYVFDTNRREFLNQDGETLRLAMELRYGLAENWDVQLEVPWLQHDGGNLDRLIDDWHDLWGMSDGGRSDVERDLLEYRYVAVGVDGYRLEDDSDGLGDITLSLSHAFYRGEDAVASLVLGWKFASGDEDDFTGSGADDGFIALRFSGGHGSDLPLRWHGQVGYLRAGDSDLLDQVQEQNLWFAGLAVDWAFAEHWSLIGQVDGHAAPMDSDITAVGDPAAMLAVGTRWRITSDWSLDLSVVEDIAVETAPDVIFQASLRYRPE
jgi:hypothetical protein